MTPLPEVMINFFHITYRNERLDYLTRASITTLLPSLRELLLPSFFQNIILILVLITACSCFLSVFLDVLIVKLELRDKNWCDKSHIFGFDHPCWLLICSYFYVQHYIGFIYIGRKYSIYMNTKIIYFHLRPHGMLKHC